MASRTSRRADGVFADFFGTGERDVFGGDIFSNFGGSGSPMSHSRALEKDPTIKNTLPCSLEEIYEGATKRVKITRTVIGARGLTTEVEEILTIDVKPGWKKGTKITFPEKGNERPNVIAADIVFIIDEKPHSEFTRDGNDLIITRRISICEAFAGYTVHLTTLDGRKLTIPINNVIHPNYQEVVPREGMPILNDPTKRGSLKIKFDVRFPTRVSAEQKAGIKRLFGP